MLNWTLALFMLAIGAATLGFGDFAGPFADVAQALFFVIVVLLLVSLLVHVVRGRPPPA